MSEPVLDVLAQLQAIQRGLESDLVEYRAKTAAAKIFLARDGRCSPQFGQEIHPIGRLSVAASSNAISGARVSAPPLEAAAECPGGMASLTELIAQPAGQVRREVGGGSDAPAADLSLRGDTAELKVVCAWCDRHLSGPAVARVSHGICPECAAKEFGHAGTWRVS